MFTAWNIGQVPAVDMEEIAKTLSWVEELNGG
jgi:hypothetical protein